MLRTPAYRVSDVSTSDSAFTDDVTPQDSLDIEDNSAEPLSDADTVATPPVRTATPSPSLSASPCVLPSA